MKIGMLWQDCDPKADLQAKIARAASYYQQKYGQVPNLVFIHPSMAPAQPGSPAATGATGIEIRTSRSVLPNHFWMGVKETS